MGAAAAGKKLTEIAQKEVIAAGKQFRAPGIGQTLKDVGSDLKGMVDDTFGSGLKDTLGNLKDTVTDIPLAPGYSIDELGKDLGSFSKDGLTNALENITGVNISGMIPTGAEIVGFVKGQISGTLNALQAEIMAEIQGCIENYLRELLNKIPELVFLLNFKKEIAKLIAGHRIKLQRMIRSQLEKLAFQKLQVQQLALLKQKLVGSIRGICKGAPGASIRNFQSNPLAIADTARKNAGKIAEQTQERAKTAAIKGYDEKKSEDIVETVQHVVSNAHIPTPPAIPARGRRPAKPKDTPPAGKKWIEGINGWFLVDKDTKDWKHASSKELADQAKKNAAVIKADKAKKSDPYAQLAEEKKAKRDGTKVVVEKKAKKPQVKPRVVSMREPYVDYSVQWYPNEVWSPTGPAVQSKWRYVDRAWDAEMILHSARGSRIYKAYYSLDYTEGKGMKRIGGDISAPGYIPAHREPPRKDGRKGKLVVDIPLSESQWTGKGSFIRKG